MSSNKPFKGPSDRRMSPEKSSKQAKETEFFDMLTVFMLK